MARRRALALASVLLIGLAACSSDGDDGSRPTLDAIVPAIEAVEAALGGAQQYFEINATAQLVNLFVADVDEGTVTPYVFAGGELQQPGDPAPVSGGTPFSADQISDDLDTILDGVTDDLPDSDVSVFVIYAGDDGPRYGATVTADEGGVLDIDLGADGEVLAVDPGT